MPTSRAYGTRYAIHPNMLTHDSHGPHAVIINMDLRVHGHVLYMAQRTGFATHSGEPSGEHSGEPRDERRHTRADPALTTG